MLFSEFIEISAINDEIKNTPSIQLQQVADKLSTGTHLTNDGERIYFCDQIGLINIIEDDITLKTPFLDITERIRKLPPSKKGRPSGLDPDYEERGLTGLAFHPNYKRNGKLYIVHADRKKETEDDDNFNHEQVLCEYQVSKNLNKVDSKSRKELLRIPQEKFTHNGGKIEFGPDGYLYWGTGDGGCCGDKPGNAQSLSSLNGKILRLDINRRDLIPPDNPFINTEGARPEIYVYGLRNPWGISFNKNSLWVAQVGEGKDETYEGWESIFIVNKRDNCGWRIKEGTHYADKDLMKKLGLKSSDFRDPIHEYDHSVGRAIIGGYVYKGDSIPELKDKYVFGDWSGNWKKGSGQIFYLSKLPTGSWRRFSFKYPKNERSLNYFVTSLGECHNKELYIMVKKGTSIKNKQGLILKLTK